MCILWIDSLCMLLRTSGATELLVAGSLQFDLASIQAATSNFSQDNKLGQGGFGEVFRVALTFFCLWRLLV